jgi:putative ATPase
MQQPLADKIRPTSLDEYIGQGHLVGSNKPLRNAIEKKHLFSFILWGPPGTGKTSLARIYADALDARLFELSAVSSGKKDVRDVVSFPSDNPKILFLDEIHRFNKAQQDFLLPYVESGEITLIGATTENPSFEIISPLLSRCRVFVLNEFNEKEMHQIIERTGLPMKEEAKEWMVKMANGDARQALTMLDSAEKLYGKITTKTLKDALQSTHLRYDKKGEEHYNIISAFIKSMRASQPNAALYYLARMLEAGEDPKFIARRMVIFASEDIGMANPTALVLANAVFRAVETIGYPEAAINLAHGVTYLCTAKKDRRSYNALRAAQSDVQEFGNLHIPMNIRNAPTKMMKEMGYGRDYEAYTDTDLRPEKIQSHNYFEDS